MSQLIILVLLGVGSGVKWLIKYVTPIRYGCYCRTHGNVTLIFEWIFSVYLPQSRSFQKMGTPLLTHGTALYIYR